MAITIRNLAQFKHFTLRGVWLYIYLKVRRRRISLMGKCHCCGQCCRSISLEDSRGWLRSASRFQRMVATHPEYGRFLISGKTSDGYLLFTCSWRALDGRCRDYENRLPICRKYPEISLVFCGAELLPGCGYAFVETADFKELLKKKMSR